MLLFNKIMKNLRTEIKKTNNGTKHKIEEKNNNTYTQFLR